MKRSLITQMRNEWRNNLWLSVALAIVSLAIWLLGAMLYEVVYPWLTPRGFDSENVVVLTHKYSGEDSGGDGAGARPYGEDLLKMLRLIRGSGNVECAALSLNAVPLRDTFYGIDATLTDDERDTVVYYGGGRWGSPDIARVLRLESRTGKTPDEIAGMLSRGEMLVSNIIDPLSSVMAPGSAPAAVLPPEQMYGKTAYVWQKPYKVGDIITMLKQTDFRMYDECGTVFLPIAESAPFEDVPGSRIQEVVVRVKPGCVEKFREEFESTPGMQEYGGSSLTDFMTLDELGEISNFNEITTVRMYSLVITLLIVLIFLGMLGTFWFRMQQRVGETAIRRVCGATAGDIFRRLVSEGLILVCAATVIAGVTGWVVVRTTGIGSSLSVASLVCLEIATMLLVACGVALSVCYPASQAMRIEPAIAIKEE